MEPSEIYAVQPSHVPRIEHPLACPVLFWYCPGVAAVLVGGRWLSHVQIR